MKIIHISDLHLDAINKQENYIRSLLLFENLVENGFDHLVITGDLTENADRSALIMVRNLLKKFNLLDSQRCTIIIGNHDIFGGVHLAEDLINFPQKCRMTNYNSKVEAFTAAFNETYSSAIYSNADSVYPFIKEFDEYILLGFNSIAEYSFLKNPFASNGKISQEQLELAEKLLKICKFKDKKIIALAHHHFCKEPLQSDISDSSVWQKVEKHTMKLRGKKKVMNFFNEINTELVLHGHLHETTSYTRKGLIFLNAGGSVLGINKNELNYNKIEISGGETKYTHEFINLPNDSSKQSRFSSRGLLYNYLDIPKTSSISLN